MVTYLSYKGNKEYKLSPKSPMQHQRDLFCGKCTFYKAVKYKFMNIDCFLSLP